MEKKPNIDNSYSAYWSNTHSQAHIYPVSYVVRIFLGKYPGIKMNKEKYRGSKILDLGFGDGRNFPLLNNLGFKISGVEISDEIVHLVSEKFKNLGLQTDLKTGRNSKIPFADKTFDFLLACDALYYVDTDGSFNENLREAARTMAPGASLVASLSMDTNYLAVGAKKLGQGHIEITKDPLNIRNGTTLRVFSSEAEIIETFSPYFENISIGWFKNDFFGLQESLWMIHCTKK